MSPSTIKNRGWPDTFTKTEVEALLCSQLILVHVLTASTLQKAIVETPHLHTFTAFTNLGIKLARTFVSQIEALDRLKQRTENPKTEKQPHGPAAEDEDAF